MNDTNNEESVTGQRIGTSEPAQEGVVKQAPPGSSSRDCGAQAVANQAVAHISTTGEYNKEGWMFQKSSRIVRTPERRHSMSAIEDSGKRGPVSKVNFKLNVPLFSEVGLSKCGVLSVGNQTETPINAIGNRQGENGGNMTSTQSSSSNRTSSGGKGKKSQMEHEESAVTLNEEINKKNEDTVMLTQVYKRKREELSPDIPSEKMITEGNAFKKTLDMVLKQIKLLEKLVDDTYKPKKELTEISSKLTFYAGKIQREGQKKWIDKVVGGKDLEQALRSENQDLRKQVEALEKGSASGTVCMEKKSIGIQANPNDIDQEWEKKNNELNEKIKTILNAQKDLNQLVQIIDEEWTEDCYKTTETKSLKSYQAEADEDVVVLVDPSIKENEEELDIMRCHYPSVVPTVQEGLQEGNMEYVKLQVEIVSSKGNNGQTQYNNTIYILPMKGNESGPEDVEIMYKLCMQLRNEVQKQNKKRLKVLTIGKLKLEYLQKCLEYVFREGDINITLCMKEKEKTYRRKSEVEGRKRRRPDIEREKIIVKAQKGKSYAELLRAVKNSVDPKEKGLKIKTIKKTNNGDLFLEVLGSRDKAVSLKQTIQEKNDNTEVIIKTNESTIHITDIDASIDENELRKEIKETEGILENQVRIISMRPTQNGNQTATVALKREIATRIVNRGKIKIGWVLCRVRKRVSLLRCFRCHLFGHKKEECTQDDRTELCLKCTKSGHKAKDCQNTPACIVCNIEGHRVDQTKCPHFRKLIMDTRRKPSTAGSVFGHD